MFIQEDDLKLNSWQFSQRKYLPWDMKMRLTAVRIREWYDNWGGQVYLSYSGGLDSTVLLDFIRKELGGSVPAVFCNTGLEFPEIVRFARGARGEFVEIAPRDRSGNRVTYQQVISTYGYPLISKETGEKVYKLRHGNLSERYKRYLLNGDERGKFGKLADKWKFLVSAPFETSSKCCEIMKKRPFHRFVRRREGSRILPQHRMKDSGGRINMPIPAAMCMMAGRLRASQLVSGQGRIFSGMWLRMTWRYVRYMAISFNVPMGLIILPANNVPAVCTVPWGLIWRRSLTGSRGCPGRIPGVMISVCVTQR